MSIYLRNFFRFGIILLLQVLVLNKISIQWWAQPYGFPVFVPYLYPLFILLLPFETPVWLLLILGMVTGLSMDAFQNTAGMHAAATVLMAYLRTNVLTALLPKHLSEFPGQSPNVKNMGWAPFLTYSFFLLLLHHLLFFTIELWSFQNMGYLLLKVVASALTTMLFVVAYLLLFTKGVQARG